MKSVFAKKAFLSDGWVDDVRLSVAGGNITALHTGVRAIDTDTQVDYVLPGLCNAHSHAFQRALAGHTEQRAPAGRDNFWSWRERMYELAARVDPEALTAVAAEAYAEMLGSGYTSVIEFHYLHRGAGVSQADGQMFAALREAANISGIRLIYTPVHYERAGFAATEPTAQQAKFCQPLDSFLQHVVDAHDSNHSSDGSYGLGIGAHSLRAVSADSLQKIAATAKQYDLPIHIHVAEQRREVDECLSHYGRRPVRWLQENFDIGARWNLVHATHMDVEEIAELASSGAVAVLCPSTEANLGDGLFALQPFLAAGGRIAIGSDSHISINAFEELRWLEYGQRLASQSRNVTSMQTAHVGAELFARALHGGAIASGAMTNGAMTSGAMTSGAMTSAGPDGHLAVGGPADFVVLNGDDPMLVGHDDATRLDALVFSGYPLPVERVMIGGEWQLENARHKRAGEITERFRTTAEMLWGRA